MNQCRRCLLLRQRWLRQDLILCILNHLLAHIWSEFEVLERYDLFNCPLEGRINLGESFRKFILRRRVVVRLFNSGARVYGICLGWSGRLTFLRRHTAVQSTYLGLKVHLFDLVSLVNRIIYH